MISNDDKKLMIATAYDAIHQHFDKQPLSALLQEKLNTSELGKITSGIFITIKLNNQLKGCIGCITSEEPLSQTLPYFAIQSAFNDPRFKPLTINEFDKITINISVLTPPQKIDDIDSIEIGNDGIIFEFKHYRSVFLPEVPTEQDWDLITTLKQLEKKANAPSESWKNASYKTFQSIKF